MVNGNFLSNIPKYWEDGEYEETFDKFYSRSPIKPHIYRIEPDFNLPSKTGGGPWWFIFDNKEFACYDEGSPSIALHPKYIEKLFIENGWMPEHEVPKLVPIC